MISIVNKIYYLILPKKMISNFILANRQLYTAPDNDELEKKIDQVDQAFAKGKEKTFVYKKLKSSFKCFS